MIVVIQSLPSKTGKFLKYLPLDRRKETQRNQVISLVLSDPISVMQNYGSPSDDLLTASASEPPSVEKIYLN